MKVVLFCHHFPPRFRGGTEQSNWRVAHGLQRRGHEVVVATIEPDQSGRLRPENQVDHSHAFPVIRAHLDLQRTNETYAYRFRNPYLGEWAAALLREQAPDLVHVKAGYILGGTVPEAAFGQGLPTIYTAHDYWYLCPEIALRRTDGTLCAAPVSPAQCVWCELSRKRRYRVADRASGGRLGRLFTAYHRRSAVGHGPLPATLQSDVVMRRSYLQSVFARFDRVITHSHFLRNRYELYGVSARDWNILENGLEGVSALRAVRETHRPVETLRIGFLGRIVPLKGVHLLIQAVNQLHAQRRGYSLTIHGPLDAASPYQQRLRKLAAGNPAIRFAGAYDAAQLPALHGQLDVMAMPSLVFENLPTVVQEAQAAGTPVVVPDNGSVGEMVDHERNGLKFKFGDADDLRRQLQRLLDEPQLVVRLRQAAPPCLSAAEELAALESAYHGVLADRQT